MRARALIAALCGLWLAACGQPAAEDGAKPAEGEAKIVSLDQFRKK